MKGLIIIPTFYLTRHTDYWKILLEMVRDEFGFELRYTDNLGKISKDINIIISFANPQHNRTGYMPELLNVSKDVKIILYVRDVQCYDDACWKWNHKVFDRADIILNATDSAFKRWYPDHYKKTIFFPQFFATYNRYADLPYNNKPKMKCLLIGAINDQVYPLRYYIKENRDPKKIDVITTSQRRKEGYIKEKYAKLLNSYFCCVTCPSIFEYATLKTTEITAAGSLLLMSDVSDMKKMGYVANEHYVPILKENALDKIYQCLRYPHRYEKIRREGKKFTLSTHSVLNRFQQLKTIIKEI
jgi:hypothetical protein